MRIRYCILSVLILSAVVFTLPLYAYEILLDIDTDFDPTTINDLTYETSTIVKLILQPDYPGEMIGRVEFGLGGSCRECDNVHFYGTNHDLINWDVQPWIQATAFDSGWQYAVHLGCYGYVSSHLVLWFEPLGGGEISLNQPIFLAEFMVWVADPVPAGCTQPPSNLAAMDGPTYWNYVQLGGPAVGNEDQSWSTLKSMYR
jgi:hypothetical protein